MSRFHDAESNGDELRSQSLDEELTASRRRMICQNIAKAIMQTASRTMPITAQDIPIPFTVLLLFRGGYSANLNDAIRICSFRRRIHGVYVYR